MNHRQPLIERAFDLARSGRCNDVADIARQLSAEGYDGVTSRMAGPSLRKQLRELCRAPRTNTLQDSVKREDGKPD